MALNHGLKIMEGAELTDRGRYQRLAGKLIYLSHTRPDIAYAVGVVSQFMHQPQVDHFEAILRIVYLKGTAGHGILFKKNGHQEIHGYTDVDWAGTRSIGGLQHVTSICWRKFSNLEEQEEKGGRPIE